METVYQRICRLISASGLPQAEQDDLAVLLSLAPEEELPPIAELFENDPGWIARTSENLKKKRKALRDGDSAAWQTILREEKTQLNTLDAQ